MRLQGFVIAAACLSAMGCSTLETQRGGFDAPGPLFVVVLNEAGRVPLSATAMFTPSSATAVFDVVDGSGKGTTITMKRAPTNRFGAAWAETEDDVRTEFYRVTDDGHILLTAALDHDERALSVFNPPLTAFYATLTPGMPQIEESHIRVLDSHNPGRQRESGTAKQTIEHLGRSVIRTTHGEFTVDRVLVQFDANLRLARARRESTLYVLDGVGVIAAEHEETITALGLFSRTSRQTLVRRDLAVAASDKR